MYIFEVYINYILVYFLSYLSIHSSINACRIPEFFLWFKVKKIGVMVQTKQKKIEWMNGFTVKWKFLGKPRDRLFSHYHRLMWFFSIPLFSILSYLWLMCVACAWYICIYVCVCSDCVMTKLSHFIQFSCVWTLNIHLDGLSVILFFYYISDNNAILKIFSNSVLLGVRTYSYIHTTDLYLMRIFQSDYWI